MKRRRDSWASNVLIATAVACCSIFPTKASAAIDYHGYNAVKGANSTSPCTTGNICPSGAFIDATAFLGSDLCAKIRGALAALPTAGGVVDARGLTAGSCSTNPFGTNTGATVLLPAGTITLSMPWILPSGTKVIGEGVGVTTLSSGGSLTSLIEMGSSILCSTTCTGIGIQDLSLTQTTSSSYAIDNEYGQVHSYVRRVTIYVGETNTVTGLKIGAQNSGPYEDITFYGESGQAPTYQGPACIWIIASAVKVKGLNCIGNLNFGVAVLLDGSNVSIEDVYITGVYTDGVLLGVNNNVSNDVLLNITGAGVNTVHVCGPNGGSGACNGPGHTVEDLSMLSISRVGANSIKDEVTSTTLTDANVAIYILGESVQVEQGVPVVAHARFTTSPNTATWGVGSSSSAPSGNCSSATKGALFSNTSGDHNTLKAFWVCGGSSGWLGIY